mgnify:CR=1 FL=1
MEKNGVLLVEGKDDKAVIGSLLFDVYEIAETFEIRDIVGHGQIFETLEIAIKERTIKNTGFEISHIGVVVDSNGDLSKRVKDFNDAIKKNRYEEAALSHDGIVITDDTKDVRTVGMDGSGTEQ